MIEFKKTRIAFADYEGETHTFSVPPYLKLKEVQSKVMEKPEEGDTIILDALVDWGIKREVLEGLELSHIKVIWEEVLFAKKNSQTKE